MLRKTLSTAFLPTRVLVSTGFVHRGRGCELQTGGLSGVVLPPMYRKGGLERRTYQRSYQRWYHGYSWGSAMAARIQILAKKGCFEHHLSEHQITSTIALSGAPRSPSRVHFGPGHIGEPRCALYDGLEIGRRSEMKDGPQHRVWIVWTLGPSKAKS